MRSKGIITLMLVVAMVLGTAIAFADSYTNNPASGIPGDGWTLSGTNTFGGTFGTGVYSTVTGTGASRATHPMNMNASGTGAFDAQFRFKLNNINSSIWLGVGTGTAQNTQRVIGWRGYSTGANQNFVLGIDGSTNFPGTSSPWVNITPNAAPSAGTEYVAHITSTNGNSLTFQIESTTGSVVAGPVTVNLPAGQRAAYLVIQINNRGQVPNPGFMTSPIVNRVEFQDMGGATTPSVSPTVTPTPIPGEMTAAYLQGIREFYANQPIVHMSNQSVVYYPNGTLKEVITGPVGNVTASPGAVVIVSPEPNVTATPVPGMATATPIPSPAATQTQAPGFEIILATIGMISALVLITRKKK